MAENETSQPAAASQKKLSVLLVDDDKFLLDMYSLKFANAGVEISTAVGSEAALKKLQEGFSPDILIMDIVMPVIDGVELLRRVKEGNLAPHATTIMLTNQSQSVDVERAKKIGVDGYVVKATTIPSELYSKVMEIHNAKVKKAG